MTRFGFNLLLALSWCLLTGSSEIWNFAAGMFFGAMTVAAYSRVTGGKPYFGSVGRIVSFLWHFLCILTKANLQIAREVITPGFTQTPAILRYSVGHLSPVQQMTLANAITLTPGTLVVDISPDNQWLYIHCMYASEPESTRAEITELEHRLMKGIFS